MLLTALLLSGCVGTPVPSAPLAVPDYLAHCPMPPHIPLPPRKPRTVDSISSWGNAEDIILRRFEDLYTECDARRAAAVQLILERQK